MLLLGLLLAATVAVGVVCAVFWDSIVGWLQRVANKLAEKIKKVVYGTKVLAMRKGGILKKISRNFVRNESEWEEYRIVKDILEDEIPDHIRDLEEDEEIDITEELELQLA